MKGILSSVARSVGRVVRTVARGVRGAFRGLGFLARGVVNVVRAVVRVARKIIRRVAPYASIAAGLIYYFVVPALTAGAATAGAAAGAASSSFLKALGTWLLPFLRSLGGLGGVGFTAGLAGYGVRIPSVTGGAVTVPWTTSAGARYAVGMLPAQ